jgi:glucose-1-phosphate adenylyltransferase
MKNTIAMLLAGGQGSRLNILATYRAKPAVPFAGIYRIIDITLSNIMNSYIDNVGILTQYRSSSLIDHIQDGESWGLCGRNRSAVILPPYTGNYASSWYEGTADAIYQNISHINKFEQIDKVLILSGDHIYNMDYSELIKFHKEKGSVVTIVSMEVPIKDASRFGTIIVDKNDRVIDFEEKPKNPKSNLVSLGIYLFDKDVLIEELKKDALNENSTHDFGRDILPSILDKEIYIYRFNGYWRDVGTIDSYWETSMDLISDDSNLDFDNWKVTTNFNRMITADRNSLYVGKDSNIKKSLISEGCIINGVVENSILSPGVVVEKGAVIKDSIVFHSSIIKEGSKLDRCIVDKEVLIGKNSTIGFGDLPGSKNEVYPTHLFSGLTVIGKKAILPEGIKIGRNCIVQPGILEENFKSKFYKDGTFISI